MRARLLVVALVRPPVLSCSDSGEPNGDDASRPASELTILHLRGDLLHPPFNPVVSFYAVRGQNREARVSFDDGQGRAGRRVSPSPDRQRLAPRQSRMVPRSPMANYVLDHHRRR